MAQERLTPELFDAIKSCGKNSLTFAAVLKNSGRQVMTVVSPYEDDEETDPQLSLCSLIISMLDTATNEIIKEATIDVGQPMPTGILRRIQQTLKEATK